MKVPFRLILSGVRTLATQGGSKKPLLYGYAKSSCSWRVRATLAYKGIEFDQVTFEPYGNPSLTELLEYLQKSPLRQVPTLEIDGQSFTQSIAILEYIEETRPEKPLLPEDPAQRARVRQIVELINSGIQPLQNPAVAERHSKDEANQKEWQVYWIENGLNALEKLLETTSGKFCVEDQLTFADLALVPQLFASRRFGADLKKYPICLRLFEKLLQLDAFRQSHPNNQPDTPDDQRGPI